MIRTEDKGWTLRSGGQLYIISELTSAIHGQGKLNYGAYRADVSLMRSRAATVITATSQKWSSQVRPPKRVRKISKANRSWDISHGLPNFMEQRIFWDAYIRFDIYSGNSLRFMNPECSLPCSQKPAPGSCPEERETSPHSTQFL